MRYDRPSWSEPKAWLGTQAYKLLYIVVLVEVLCGVGRLSTTMEGALPDCSVIRIGYAYGHDLGLPLHRWYFQWPVRALCPAHVWFSWPCTYVGSWSRYKEVRHGPETAEMILQQGRRRTRLWVRIFISVCQWQIITQHHGHGENPLNNETWEWKEFERLPAWRVVFHQRMDGLKRPSPEEPGRYRKPTACSDYKPFNGACPSGQSKSLWSWRMDWRIPLR